MLRQEETMLKQNNTSDDLVSLPWAKIFTIDPALIRYLNSFFANENYFGLNNKIEPSFDLTVNEMLFCYLKNGLDVSTETYNKRYKLIESSIHGVFLNSKYLKLLINPKIDPKDVSIILKRDGHKKIDEVLNRLKNIYNLNEEEILSAYLISSPNEVDFKYRMSFIARSRIDPIDWLFKNKFNLSFVNYLLRKCNQDTYDFVDLMIKSKKASCLHCFEGWEYDNGVKLFTWFRAYNVKVLGNNDTYNYWVLKKYAFMEKIFARPLDLNDTTLCAMFSDVQNSKSETVEKSKLAPLISFFPKKTAPDKPIQKGSKNKFNEEEQVMLVTTEASSDQKKIKFDDLLHSPSVYFPGLFQPITHDFKQPSEFTIGFRDNPINTTSSNHLTPIVGDALDLMNGEQLKVSHTIIKFN